MEFAPLAAAETGMDPADIAATQAALEEWFVPVLAIGALLFGIGVLAFIRGITATGILSTPLTALVVGALAVMALSRFVPLTAAQFYCRAQPGSWRSGRWPITCGDARRQEPQPSRAGLLRPFARDPSARSHE